LAPYNRSERYTGIARFENAFLIYNPAAGSLSRHPHILEETRHTLTPQMGSLHLMPTRGPNTAASLAQDCLAKGADVILVAGGDGTLNEVINGMAGSNVPVAILPGGTANVLATEVKLGGDMRPVARSFASLQVTHVPLARLCAQDESSRYFLLMAGVGLDAIIIERVSPEWKRRLGKASYWAGGFSMLGARLPEFDVFIDGVKSRVSFLLASCVRNYGGDLQIARHANLLEPQLAIVLFEGASSFRYLKYFTGVLTGTLPRIRGVTVTKAQSVSAEIVSGKNVPVQLDGEWCGRLPATIEVTSQTLPILLPPAFVSDAERRLSVEAPVLG
jgi:diacylglycerol kinase (ATP)